MRLQANIHVTLKPGVNDPQGLAIADGLRGLGFDNVGGVRAGRYLEVQLDARDRAEAEGQLAAMCERLLANTVIETYRFEVVDAPAEAEDTAGAEASTAAEASVG